jgi:hypothetical protein
MGTAWPTSRARVQGSSDAAASLANERDRALRSEDTSDDRAKPLIDRRSGIAEVLVPPRSPLIGSDMFVARGGRTHRHRVASVFLVPVIWPIQAGRP